MHRPKKRAPIALYGLTPRTLFESAQHLNSHTSYFMYYLLSYLSCTHNVTIFLLRE